MPTKLLIQNGRTIQELGKRMDEAFGEWMKEPKRLLKLLRKMDERTEKIAELIVMESEKTRELIDKSFHQTRELIKTLRG